MMLPIRSLRLSEQFFICSNRGRLIRQLSITVISWPNYPTTRIQLVASSTRWIWWRGRSDWQDRLGRIPMVFPMWTICPLLRTWQNYACFAWKTINSEKLSTPSSTIANTTSNKRINLEKLDWIRDGSNGKTPTRCYGKDGMEWKRVSLPTQALVWPPHILPTSEEDPTNS
jgi:hypothetical protein